MTITVRDLLSRRGDPLQLEPLTGELGLDRPLPDPEVASPGLALAGYTSRFMPRRLHVLGETEISYLRELDAPERQSRLEKFFAFELPCVFVTKALEVPAELLDLARVRGTPLIRSRLKTAEFYKRLKPIVEEAATAYAALARRRGLSPVQLALGYVKSRWYLGAVILAYRLPTRRQMHAVRMGGKEGGGLVAEAQVPVTKVVLVHPGDRIEKAGDEGLFAG